MLFFNFKQQMLFNKSHQLSVAFVSYVLAGIKAKILKRSVCIKVLKAEQLNIFMHIW